MFELRKTLCVSSQVGCRLGFSFCATGTMKMQGNLYAGEICEQLLQAERVLKVLGLIEREQAAQDRAEEMAAALELEGDEDDHSHSNSSAHGLSLSASSSRMRGVGGKNRSAANASDVVTLLSLGGATGAGHTGVGGGKQLNWNAG